MPGRNYTMMGRDLWDLNQLNGRPFGSLSIGQKFNFGEAPIKTIEEFEYPEEQTTFEKYYKQMLDVLNFHNFIGDYEQPQTLRYQQGKKLVYQPYINNNKSKNSENLIYRSFLSNEDDINYAFTNPEIKNFLYTAPSYPVESVTIYKPSTTVSNTTNTENIVEDTSKPEDIVEQQQTVEETPVVTGSVEYKSNDIDVGKMKDIIDFLVSKGAKLRITSGVRPGAIAKQTGNLSRHHYGLAIDVTPGKNSNWNELRSILTNPEILKYFKEHGYRVLDETSKTMQAKTGATGPHFHIELIK